MSIGEDIGIPEITKLYIDLGLYYYHWFNTSVGGHLVPGVSATH
jgi:hypothetical protein